ncbi:MAG: dehydrogenase, FAD-containing subunit [Pseudonocardiales bacterium]|nr:dehydrogenase, FAD-containing subunit [Pseudonocardiales bacterium]
MSSSRGDCLQILVAGGGYVGLYAALRLQRAQRRLPIEITVVNPDNFMLFRPLLPEVASGTLEPRHAVVPLREALPHCSFVSGHLVGIDAGQHTASLRLADGSSTEHHFDQLVVALGAVSRVLPIPGLDEHALGFTSIAEALALRNHVLGRLEAAQATSDPAVRARALTFVVVGGGYTGVEALAELQDLSADACRWYSDISPTDLRWVLVEATERLLPTLPEDLEAHAVRVLKGRAVEICLNTELKSAQAGSIELSNGTTLATDTLVWVAGIRPDPLVSELGLPVDDKGRLVVGATLRVEGFDVWAAGDCAAVPDLVAGGTCPPTAQYAVRQGRTLGDNVAAVLAGREPKPFEYKSKGEFVTLGQRKGVAEVMGRSLTGLPAWTARRAYYCATIPTLNRKIRTTADWLISLPSHHDTSDLTSERRPQEPIQAASTS